MINNLRLVYVFDTNATTGYLCRVPRFLARLITSPILRTSLDYADTPDGESL